MSILVRRNAFLLLKGDGVYAYYGGQAHLLTAPPPEAFNPNKEEEDVPAFAHYGNSNQHPRVGHLSVGNLIPGKTLRGGGKYGETVYRDFDGKDHHHGIDGVLSHIGRMLEEKGMLGARDPRMGELTPKAIVQRAIDEYNRTHTDRDGHHHLPDVDSIEWRKLSATPWSRKDSTSSNRSMDGVFPTLLTNNRPHARLGTFIESYSIPFWKELGEILTNQLRMDNAENVEWVTRPHISIDDLHPAGRRLKGRGDGAVGPDGRLPKSHMRDTPEGVSHDQALGPVHSWEVVHHTPDMFHYKLSRQQTTPVSTKKSAIGHIKLALQRLQQKGLPVPDTPVPINVEATSGGTNYQMVPLNTVVSSDVMLKNLLEELSTTQSLNFLFGRVMSRGKNAKGPGARMMQHLLEQYGGDPEDPENKGRNFSTLDTHVQGAAHIPIDKEYFTGGGRHPTSDGSTHHTAAKLYAKAHLAEYSDADNLRDYHPENHEVASALGIDRESIKGVDQRRAGAQALADMLATAFGGTPQKPLVEEENLPANPLSTGMLIGYPEEGLDLPEYIPFITPVALPPAGVPSAGDARREAPPAASPAAVAPAEREVLHSPPTTAAAPAAHRAAPAPRVAVRQPFLPNVGSAMMRPQTQEIADARRQVGEMNPEQLREFMAATAYGPRPGETRIVPGAYDASEAPFLPTQRVVGPELSARERQFQQTFGDPAQRLLTQYMKSQSEALPEADRLMKAMEDMQRDAAKTESTVMKHALTRPVNIADEMGVRHLAKQLNLTPLDVRSIAQQLGDWERIAKRLNVKSDIVKVIKVSIGGV